MAAQATNGTGERHNPKTVWPVPEMFRPIYAHAVEVPAGQRLLLVSGQIGLSVDGTLASDFAAQCEQAMDNVERLLEGAGLSRANLVKVTYYLTRADDLPRLGEIRQRRWASDAPPAVTTLVVAALARPDFLVEVEAMAVAS
jgi:enamine deaminase RidA (YjgF/YER057c/UK114 family)